MNTSAIPAVSLSPTAPDVDAIVVGAGLGGLYSLYRLRGLGMTAQVIEAGSDVGGTWYWNRYPGARCDVESIDYSYSFSEELQQEWSWTERYATQKEILAYIQHVADRFDLRRSIAFNTRVQSAAFDESSDLWVVTTDAGDVLRARICVMATGSLSTPKVPDLPGLDDFAGDYYHSAAWPHEDEPNFEGRRVALIGTGSTGIQLTPELARQAAQLYVLQRTANFSMPAHNSPLDEQTLEQVKANYPERRRISRRTRRGFPLPAGATAESALSFSEQDREERYRKMWAHGGAVFTSTFGDLTVDREANRTAADFVRARIREIVEDPETAELLCPTDHPIGTKRPCVDTQYYQTFNKPNVSLVDLKSEPIVAITPRGLRTERDEYEVDAIVFATGFDAITGTLLRIDIRGRSGVSLKDHWSDGPRAYLGLAMAGFPNMFIITGPGSPSVLCNMIVSIEQHVELMVDLLEIMQEGGCRTVEATADAEAGWVAHVNEIAAQTLHMEANSWYTGANVPGKPRVFMPYAGGMAAFDETCQRIAGEGYPGLVFAQDSELVQSSSAAG